MTNEIKEILDNIKYPLDNKTKIILMTYKNAEILYNYITNLQEKNEKLKEQCKEWKGNHKAVCIQRDNILDNVVKDVDDRIDYKSRITKAKKEISALLNRYLFEEDFYIEDFHLENILKTLDGEENGGDEE